MIAIAAGLTAALPSLLGAAATRFSDSTVFKWVNLALGIVIEGVEVKRKMGELNDMIQGFIDEDREPSADEWDQMLARSDAAHDVIQNA